MTCIVKSPPGAKRVMCVKLISLIVNKDSIKEIPVSEAPTTTILVLLEILTYESIFFVIKDKENGDSY